MDLAIYISELLGLRGEVSVPGIGYFSQIRINGYYNEQENKFYPPAYQVNFEPHPKDDNELANYITSKKNISLASSQYFVGKYTINLKEQITLKTVAIEGIGYLRNNNSIIEFKADNSIKEHDPAFYGFIPVNVHPREQNPEINNILPNKEKAYSNTETLSVAPPLPDPVLVEEAQMQEASEYVYEEQETSESNNNTLIILLLIAIIGLLAILGLYKYKPAWFNKEESTHTLIIIKKSDTLTNELDTTEKSVSKQDSAVKTTAQPAKALPITNIDTAHKIRWEIIGGSFETEKAAKLSIKNYKSIGLDAKIVPNASGKRIRLTLGTYYTEQEALKAKEDLIKTKKVNKDIYTLKINSTK